ncbi:phage tail protein [Nocardia sp. IFM 10818]
MAGPGGTEVNRISIRVVPDTTGFRKKLKKDLEKATEGLQQKVKIGVDTKGLRTKVQTAIRQAVQGVHKVELDVAVKRGEAAKVGKEVEKAADAANPQVDVGVNSARFWREFEAMLAKARGRSVDVDVTINRRVFTTRYTQEFRRIEREMYSFERRYRETFDRMGRDSDGWAGRFQDNSTRISDSFNNSVTNIRRGWLTLKRLIFLVAALAGPAIGLVAGLLASLPSLGAAAGLAIGAVALGMDGIKGAAQELKPELDALKAAVSNVFKERLDSQFQQLKDSGLITQLTDGFRYVANGLMDMSQGFFDVITSAKGMEQINTIMGRTALLFSDLKPFIADMTSGFLTLAESGANNFGKLSASLNKWAADFKSTVARMAESGQLDQMFTGLSATFDGLASGFNRLFEAGVNAMGKLGQPIGRFLEQIGSFFLKVEPILSAFAGNILNVGSQILESLGTVFEKLSPSIVAFMDLLGSGLTTGIRILGEALTPIAEMLNTVFLAGLNAIRPILPELQAAFQQLAMAISQALANPEMQAALTELVTTVFPQLLSVLPPLITMLADIVTKIAPILPYLIQLQTLILQTVIPALKLLLAVGVSVWEGIKAAFSIGLDAIKTTVKMIGAILNGDWEQVWELFVAFVKRAILRALQAFANALPSWTDVLTSLINLAKSWGEKIVALLKKIGLNMMANLIQGILDKLGPLGDVLKKVSGMIASAFGTNDEGGGGGPDIGLDIPIAPAIEDLTTELTDGLAGKEEWVYDGGYSLGGAAGQGVADGLKDKQQDVEKMRQQIEQAAGIFDSTYASMMGSGKKDQDPLKRFADRADELQETLQDLAIDRQILLAMGDRGDPEGFQEELASLSEQAIAAQAELDALNGMMDEIYNQRKANDPFRDVTNLLDIGKTDWNQLLQQLGLAPAAVKDVAQTAGETYADGFTSGFGTIEDKFKAMINRFGESQGIEDIVGKWETALEESGLDTWGEDFVKEQSNEFFGDLGFGSGNGFIGKAIDNVPNIIYNVSSVDEVNTNERNRQNRQKYQYTGA